MQTGDEISLSIKYSLLRNAFRYLLFKYKEQRGHQMTQNLLKLYRICQTVEVEWWTT